MRSLHWVVALAFAMFLSGAAHAQGRSVLIEGNRAQVVREPAAAVSDETVSVFNVGLPVERTTTVSFEAEEPEQDQPSDEELLADLFRTRIGAFRGRSAGERDTNAAASAARSTDETLDADVAETIEFVTSSRTRRLIELIRRLRERERPGGGGEGEGPGGGGEGDGAGGGGEGEGPGGGGEGEGPGGGGEGEGPGGGGEEEPTPPAPGEGEGERPEREPVSP